MKDWKVYVKVIAWSVLVLLLIPPLWYSLRTPFALIDDYSDWSIVRSFSHVSGIILWFQDTWFHPQDRFRITYDLYNLVTWALFGDNSAWHHAMRWVLKAIVVWSTFNILRLMAPAVRSARELPFWMFCVVYIFFPNNPEARLAPQELLTVTFLSLLLYELGRLFVLVRGDLGILSLRRYSWLLFVFIAMLWSKEPNIVMGVFTFLILACLNLKRWIRLLPFAAVLLITGLRVWAESHVGGYGVVPATWNLIFHNIGAFRRGLFLEKISLLCTFFLAVSFLLCVACLVVQTRKKRPLRAHPVLMFRWFVFLSMLAFYADILTSWDASIRYFYPLVYLLALWIGLTLLELGSFLPPWRQVVTGFMIISSVYFIGAVYYHFVYQFACQYYTRVVEQDVLHTTDQLLRDGRTVTLTLDSEYEDKIRWYFNDYLPYYKKTAYRIKTGPIMAPRDGCYYVTRNEMALPAGHQWYRHFDGYHVSKILWWCDRISTWFNFGHRPHLRVDSGVAGIGRYGEGIQNWYIYDCRDIFSRTF